MRLGGWQKLSALDFPGKLCCTVFTAGCALRCPFCYNPSLVLPERFPPPLPAERVLAFLEIRRGLLDGVCVSGGEPLLQPDLPDFLRAVRALGFAIKMDTNGTQPERLETLLKAGLLNYVAMDIKNEPDRYAQTVGLTDFDPAPVLRSARLLLRGGVEYEFRTTVVRELHDAAAFDAIGRWLAGARRYRLQPYRPTDDQLGNGLTAPSGEELTRYTDRLSAYIGDVAMR